MKHKQLEPVEEEPIVKNINLEIAQEAVKEVQMEQKDNAQEKKEPPRETVTTPTQADSKLIAMMTPKRKAFTFTCLALIIVLNLAALILSLFFDMSKDKYKE